MNVQSIGFHQSGMLSVVHLVTGEVDTLEYVACRRAFNEKMIEVREVSEAGSVNHLVVVNLSDHYVFLMDGDVLEGAKQTRTLNTSVYLSPHSKTIIPVSCVERGRWRYTSRTFETGGYSPPIDVRESKIRSVSASLRGGLGHASDQMKVWDRVEHVHQRMGTASPTGSLSDAFSGRQQDLDQFLRGIDPHPGANGVAFFSGGRLMSADVFNRRDVCAEYFPVLVRGAASETFHLAPQNLPLAEAEAMFRAVDFLDRIDALESTSNRGVALGEERRFDTKEAAGFSLTHAGRLVHLAALNLSSDTSRPS